MSVRKVTNPGVLRVAGVAGVDHDGLDRSRVVYRVVTELDQGRMGGEHHQHAFDGSQSLRPIASGPAQRPGVQLFVEHKGTRVATTAKRPEHRGSHTERARRIRGVGAEVEEPKQFRSGIEGAVEQTDVQEEPIEQTAGSLLDGEVEAWVGRWIANVRAPSDPNPVPLANPRPLRGPREPRRARALRGKRTARRPAALPPPLLRRRAGWDRPPSLGSRQRSRRWRHPRATPTSRAPMKPAATRAARRRVIRMCSRSG